MISCPNRVETLILGILVALVAFQPAVATTIAQSPQSSFSMTSTHYVQVTPSISNTRSSPLSFSMTNTRSPTVSPSMTASPSNTRSISYSASNTESTSMSASASPTLSISPTMSMTPSFSPMVPGYIYQFGGVCGSSFAPSPLDYVGKDARLVQLGGVDGMSVDKQGNILFSNFLDKFVMKIAVDTNIISWVAGGGDLPLTSYSDAHPATSVAIYGFIRLIELDNKDNLYIVSDQAILRVTKATGIMRMFAGSYVDTGYSGDGGSASNARFNYITGLAFDAVDNMYIADSMNDAIRKITASTGIVSTIAGGNARGFSGDGGPAVLAQLHYPGGIVIEPRSGDVIFSDEDNHAIRRVSNKTGIITNFAGAQYPVYPTYSEGISDDYNYHPDHSHDMLSDGDGGPATAANLSWPHSLALDTWGSLYFVDEYYNRVRRVDAGSGIITAVAGYGSTSVGTNGGPAYSSTFPWLLNIKVTPKGDLLTADEELNCIIKVYRGAASPASTPSSTPSHSPTRSVTPTHSLSRTKTATHTSTASRSHTARPTPTHTATATASGSRSPPATHSRSRSTSTTSSSSPRATVSTSMTRKAKVS